MNRAATIEETAAQWLARRMEPEWSAAGEAALAAWLDQSMAHKAAFWRLEEGWRMADRIGALSGAGRGSGAVPRAPLWRDRWIWGALAASVLVMVAGALLWIAVPRPDRTPPVEVATAIGEQRAIPLADGSKVELNTRTRLRSRVTSAAREVWLDRGEAYFDVAHDAARPFVVHAGPRTVTVLGTRFSVEREGARVRVQVVEGRVRIENSGGTGGASTIVTRGDIALARGASMLVTSGPVERVENALSWREGRLTFDGQSLGQVAEQFNRYNHVRIVVTDPDVAAIRIGGSFQATNAEAFTRLLQDAYGLRVVRAGDHITISQ